MLGAQGYQLHLCQCGGRGRSRRLAEDAFGASVNARSTCLKVTPAPEPPQSTACDQRRRKVLEKRERGDLSSLTKVEIVVCCTILLAMPALRIAPCPIVLSYGIGVMRLDMRP